MVWLHNSSGHMGLVEGVSSVVLSLDPVDESSVTRTTQKITVNFGSWDGQFRKFAWGKSEVGMVNFGSSYGENRKLRWSISEVGAVN